MLELVSFAYCFELLPHLNGMNSACFPVHLSEGLSKEVEKGVGDLGALAKSG